MSTEVYVTVHCAKTDYPSEYLFASMELAEQSVAMTYAHREDKPERTVLPSGMIMYDDGTYIIFLAERQRINLPVRNEPEHL